MYFGLEGHQIVEDSSILQLTHRLKYLTTSICIIISIHRPENLNFCHLLDTSAARGISTK